MVTTRSSLPAPRRALVLAVLAVAGLAYPLLVLLAPGRVDPHWLALLPLALALARAWATRQRFWLGVALLAALLAGASLAGAAWLPLKLYPVLVNAALLCVFGASLWRGPSIVERLARLREPDLAPAGVAYTRRVTQVWCGFFVLNGALALATALWARPAIWALYNGVIAYVAMGALMGAEWLVRRRVRARDAAAARAGALHG